MPLREDLLTPIPGENAAGPNLRYDRVYDQIKEARTEEDDTLPAGAWERQAKRADFRLAARLAGDALATRSKDLQLAAWLGEASFKLEGISVMGPVLLLLLQLQESFWDSLHPEMDEGDLGLRAVPLQWAVTRYAGLVRTTPLTRQGVNFEEYKSARAIGTEAETSDNPQRRAAREQAVADGKPTSEDVDERIAATPKAFYVALDGQLAAAEEALDALQAFSDQRYGDEAPSFRKLREALEEVHNLVSALLKEKRRLDPDPVDEAPVQEPEIAATSAHATEADDSAGWVAPPVVESVPLPGAPAAAAAYVVTEPDTVDDALGRIEGAIGYIGGQSPESQLPFVLRSAMRLSELREAILYSQPDRLEAPSTALRQNLKRAAAEADWLSVHSASLAALGEPCGRGWLDLYRYLWTSCRELGWQAQQFSIAAALQQCLREFPDLPTRSLNDDTPAANQETVLWIATEIDPKPVPAPQVSAPEPQLESALAGEAEATASAEDALETARALAARGDIHGAIQCLSRDAAQQTVGRLRFQRNLQIAALCVENGKSAVAVPLLQALVREVEERRLETWEPLDLASRPYALLLQCGSGANLDAASIFARLCSIDPGTALTIAPETGR